MLCSRHAYLCCCCCCSLLPAAAVCPLPSQPPHSSLPLSPVSLRWPYGSCCVSTKSIASMIAADAVHQAYHQRHSNKFPHLGTAWYLRSNPIPNYPTGSPVTPKPNQTNVFTGMWHHTRLDNYDMSLLELGFIETPEHTIYVITCIWTLIYFSQREADGRCVQYSIKSSV